VRTLPGNMLETSISWDKGLKQSYRLRDCFPYITQTIPQRYSPTWPFWVERYVKNRVRVVLDIRMISWQGDTINLCAVFERQVTGPSCQSIGGMTPGLDIKVDIDSCSNEIESVVFVLNAQLLQEPQRLTLWQPLRSLIRLQRFDDSLCGCRHVMHFFSRSIKKKFALFVENRKLGPSIGIYSGETPSQVIESRPEVIKHISNKHEQPIGRCMLIKNLSEEIAGWNILLSDNFVWAGQQEGRNLIVQGLQVFVCSNELHGERGYCFHD